MKFVLTYDGPLASSGSARKKHAIRQALHPQLKDLWEIHPGMNSEHYSEVEYPHLGGVSVTRNVGAYQFAPLVCDELKLLAKLDMLVLRPGWAGSLIKGGDLDNRLKTMIDALRCPESNQEIPKGYEQSEQERPLYCLLDDDRRIIEIRVRTETLLAPREPSWVRVVTEVTLYPEQRIFATMGIL